VINSDTCWDLPKTPESIICVGGGIIGVELACMFNALGSKVTIVEMLPNILVPSMMKYAACSRVSSVDVASRL